MEMQIVAWLAAGLVFMSFFMKTIVPLRTMAIASNIVFICYALMGIHFGVFDKVLPIFVLHVALLPLNLIRLREVKKTIRDVEAASQASPSLDFLLPYMTRETFASGACLFRKGDDADRMYLLHSGKVHLGELNKTLSPGDVFGEVGVFAEHAQRSSSAICEGDCELFSVSREKAIELFYQDPKFGFYIVRALARYVAEGVAPQSEGELKRVA
ncbi:cyclic nucleotide-binding domain-containing protein [Dechloromonas sp. ZS-1]|uniref:Crp/Fnr family transcriptional regulator n=1 Tax=Dechloromonas sp. ZS-1 TaxID=3138067 RepID=UPI0031FBFF87